MLSKILLVGVQSKQAERISCLIKKAFVNAEISHCCPDGNWIQCVEKEQPDLLLLGKLPQSDQDLFETCRILGSRATTSRVSVILVVSISVTPTDRIKAFQAGAFGIIAQPLSEQELLPLLAFTLPLKFQRFQSEERMNRDQKLVEEWETRIRFQLLFNYSPDNIMLLDGFGQILDVNLSTCQLMGMPRNDLVGAPFAALVISDDRVKISDALEKVASGKVSSFSRQEFVSSEIGIQLEINFAVKTMFGHEAGILIRLRDISNSNQETAVQVKTIRDRQILAEEDHDRLAMVVRQIAEAVIITDIKGAILYVNPAFENDTGYNSNEIIGKNTRILNSGRLENHFFKLMWQTLLQGKVWTGRLVDKRKDGSLFDIHQIITPVKDASGKIVNFISVWRDITNERRLEEAVRQSQKMDAVGRLASGIAHDFNNVVAAIIGYAEILLDKVKDQQELSEHTREILSNAERASNLTRQLLTFSRRQPEKLQTLSLNEVLTSMHPLLQRTLTNDVELVTLIGDGIGYVHADFGQMEQAVLNLAINARDAMKGSGKLVVETKREFLSAEDCLKRVGAKPGDYVILSVKDSGQGMSEETMQHIFEPFFTTKKAGKGTGLGLAVVYGIVKQHHGWIEVYSGIGKGTEFRIYLPRVESKQKLPPSLEPQAQELKGKEAILVIDDDDHVRHSLELMLSSLDYHVIAAASGQEAIQLLEKGLTKLDLVVCDMIMPLMNGRQTLAQIKKIQPGLKALIITGYSEVTEEEHIGSNSSVPILQKPFTREKLAVCIRAILDS